MGERVDTTQPVDPRVRCGCGWQGRMSERKALPGHAPGSVYSACPVCGSPDMYLAGEDAPEERREG